MKEFIRKMNEKGEVIVPKYFRDKHNLHPGDTITLASGPDGIYVKKGNIICFQIINENQRKVHKT